MEAGPNTEMSSPRRSRRDRRYPVGSTRREATHEPQGRAGVSPAIGWRSRRRDLPWQWVQSVLWAAGTPALRSSQNCSVSPRSDGLEMRTLFFEDPKLGEN